MSASPAIIDVQEAPLPDQPLFGALTVATAGTAVTFGGAYSLRVGLWVKAHQSNAGTVYVGTRGVARSQGYYLFPGESVFIPSRQLADLGLNADSNGDGVSFLGA